MEQLSLWAGGDSLPAAPSQESKEELTGAVQELSLHDQLVQEFVAVMQWAQQHGWWELSYLQSDGSRERIGLGKDKWDSFAAHEGLYDVGRAHFFARQWEFLETQPGQTAGEFVVDVPSPVPPLVLSCSHWLSTYSSTSLQTRLPSAEKICSYPDEHTSVFLQLCGELRTAERR